MNIRKCFSVAVIAIAGLVGQGCTQAQLNDWADCGRASVGVGLGLEVHTRLGCVTQPAIGYASETCRIGHENCTTTGMWHEDQLVWPLSANRPADLDGCDSGALNWSSVRTMLNGDERSPYTERYGFWLAADAAPYYEFPFRPTGPFKFRELTDFEIGGTLGVVSARVGINPLEIVDLALSPFGLDIAGDDNRAEEDIDAIPGDMDRATRGDFRVRRMVKKLAQERGQMSEQERRKLEKNIAEQKRKVREEWESRTRLGTDGD